MSLELRSLEGLDPEAIREAFVDAFSDYAVRIDMPPAKFLEFLRTRSFSPAASLGAFEGGRLQGFILAGLRNLSGEAWAYDIATGVRQDCQGQGLGDALLKSLLGRLKADGRVGFRLEVLTGNEAAQALYGRNGFRTTRTFHCFEAEAGHLGSPPALPEGLRPLRDDEVSEDILAGLLGFEASWQNSLASYREARDRHLALGFGPPGRPTGYGIVHRETGSVLQLGLAPAARTKPLAAALLGALASAAAAPKLRLLNVEGGSAMDGLLEGLGLPHPVDQYEMALRLA